MLLISPIVLGYLYPTLLGVLIGITGAGTAHWTLSLLFAGYWTWVGYYFAHMRIPHNQALSIGLLPILISFGFFIYEFFVARTRGYFLTRLAQLYVVYFVNWAARLVSLFTHEISGSMSGIVAYGLSLGIFCLGFGFGSYRKGSGARLGI